MLLCVLAVVASCGQSEPDVQSFRFAELVVLDATSQSPNGGRADAIGPTWYFLVGLEESGCGVDPDRCVVERVAAQVGVGLTTVAEEQSVGWWTHRAIYQDPGEGSVSVGPLEDFDGFYRSEQWISERFRSVAGDDRRTWVVVIDGALTQE